MQLRILAVDHEQDTLNIFKSTVAPLGFDVMTMADGREAATRMAKDKFDLVALGDGLPHDGGFELAKALRDSPSNRGVPILMFTGEARGETMRRGFALGVTFYLEKPLNAEKLRGLFAAARGVMLQQRRRYVRLPVRVPVEVAADGRRFQTRSIDISQGGMLLEVSGGLAPGEIVEAKFSLPGVRESLMMSGKVVRKLSPDGIAVEFLEPKQMERAALQFFVTDQTAK